MQDEPAAAAHLRPARKQWRPADKCVAGAPATIYRPAPGAYKSATTRRPAAYLIGRARAYLHLARAPAAKN